MNMDYVVITYYCALFYCLIKYLEALTVSIDNIYGTYYN